jgi:hypothetical protein
MSVGGRAYCEVIVVSADFDERWTSERIIDSRCEGSPAMINEPKPRDTITTRGGRPAQQLRTL